MQCVIVTIYFDFIFTFLYRMYNNIEQIFSILNFPISIVSHIYNHEQMFLLKLLLRIFIFCFMFRIKRVTPDTFVIYAAFACFHFVEFGFVFFSVLPFLAKQKSNIYKEQMIFCCNDFSIITGPKGIYIHTFYIVFTESENVFFLLFGFHYVYFVLVPSAAATARQCQQ